MELRWLLILIWVVVSNLAFADAFKCRTPSGKVVISDTGCYGSDNLERVQARENISLERQQQARDVNDRNANQLQNFESENSAYRESVRQQNEAIARSDAHQVALAKQLENTKNIERQQDDCKDLVWKNHSRSQGAALAEICAKQEPDNRKFNDCKDQIARANTPTQRAMIAANCTGDANAGARVIKASRPSPVHVPPPQAPLAIIKNCNGGSCSDQMGNRYNTTLGKTVRSDGKRCYQQGNAMYCD